ncbi:Lipocalin-like domain-containing protein [Pedobacter sp. ok626]|nr:Lipocalin-like domain-containing protein [Pedobacter sp. ok626]
MGIVSHILNLLFYTNFKTYLNKTIMKNFTLLILLLITTVSITGCKKDKDEDSGGIVGKWYLYSYINIVYTNGKVTDQTSQTAPDRSNYIEFKSNGTAADNEGDQFSYKINGTQLILKDLEDGEEELYEIKKINNTELVIFNELVQQAGSDQIKYTTETTFKK